MAPKAKDKALIPLKNVNIQSKIYRTSYRIRLWLKTDLNFHLI